MPRSKCCPGKRYGALRGVECPLRSLSVVDIRLIALIAKPVVLYISTVFQRKGNADVFYHASAKSVGVREKFGVPAKSSTQCQPVASQPQRKKRHRKLMCVHGCC